MGSSEGRLAAHDGWKSGHVHPTARSQGVVGRSLIGRPMTARSLMPYVLIIHEVADYAAWKKVFDGAAEIRKAAGERSYQVLKYQNDTNRIVHFSTWTSIEEARRFFESPQLVKIRAEAGVKSPEFIYLEQLEAGTL